MLVVDIIHLTYGPSMVDGMIDAATVIDAQINYGIPSLKSTLKNWSV
jgi:hypothetical protein